MRARRDSDSISEASEPPEFSADEAEDVMRNRGSISRNMIKEMFIGGGERSSRSPSRSESPGGRPPQRRHDDVRSPLRSTAGRVDGAFEVGADDDSDIER
jgi:hypothetical protein